MSSTEPATQQAGEASGGTNPRQMPMIIYILYLVGFLTTITALIGLVLAYVNRGTAPAWVGTHYTFQIRTFWLGLAMLAVGTVLTPFGIGFLILLVWMVWTIVRCAVGLSRLSDNRGIDAPESFWIGR